MDANIKRRPSWRKLLSQHTGAFLQKLDTAQLLCSNLQKLSHELRRFFVQIIGTPEDASLFWSRIPSVRHACAQQETYDVQWGAEAYAYVHLLDRYWRTWMALRRMFELRVLPLGDRLEILDVGTGPAPTAFAIRDFYRELAVYATDCGEARLAPPLYFTLVEFSDGFRRLLHGFAEYGVGASYDNTVQAVNPYWIKIADFNDIDPAPQRRLKYRELSRAGYEDGDEWWPAYTPDEANDIAQMEQRFRFLCFGNFFSEGRTVQAFEKPLRSLFADARAGTLSLFLGHTGPSHQGVLTDIAAIAGEYRFVAINSPTGESFNDAPTLAVQRLIKQTQFDVYQHLESLAGTAALPKKKGKIVWPDYWTPVVNRHKKHAFNTAIYRKGKWPRFGRRSPATGRGDGDEQNGG